MSADWGYHNEYLIHEDNAGTLFLTKALPSQVTPWSKYYASKIIWFREEIEKRGIKLLNIDTVQQLGGVIAKGFPRATF